MTGQEVSLTVNGDEAQVDTLVNILQDAGASVQTSQVRQLDGAAATSWLAIASIAIPVAPALIDSMREFLTRDRVKRVTIKTPEGHNMDVDNPDAESVAKLIEVLSSGRDR